MRVSVAPCYIHRIFDNDAMGKESSADEFNGKQLTERGFEVWLLNKGSQPCHHIAVFVLNILAYYCLVDRKEAACNCDISNLCVTV